MSFKMLNFIKINFYEIIESEIGTMNLKSYYFFPGNGIKAVQSMLK